MTDGRPEVPALAMTNIPAEELIKLLAEKDLVAPEVLEELRNQVAMSRKGPKPIHAAALAKILVDKGYLSRLSAQRLMAKLESDWAQKTHRQKPDPLLLKPKPATPSPAEGEIRLADEEEPVIDLIALEDDASVPPPVPQKAATAQPPAEAKPQQTEPPVPDEEKSQVDDLLSTLTPATTAPATAPPVTWERRRKSPWESPLFLLGGGVLLLLVFVGIVLLWSLNRRTGDELLSEADADFHSGSYTQAIYKYGKFLEDFPQHPQAGLARVRSGLARIRQTLESSDPITAFQTVKQIVPEIAALPDFHAEADAEMAAVLPGLAQQIAQQALEKRDPAIVSVGEEALSLCNRYVPKERFPAAKLADIQATLELAKRSISEKDALAATVRQVAECRASGKLDEAYAIFERFAREYPRSRNDPELQKAMSELAEAEKERVRFEPAQETKSPALPVLPFREFGLYSSWIGGRAPCSESAIAVLGDQECVYAVQMATGQVLWQRFVGGIFAEYPSNTYPRIAVGGQETVAVPDPSSQGVILVDAATGHISRFIRLGEPPASWVLTERSYLLVLGRSGNLLILNPLESQKVGTFRFPQPAAYPPAVDPVTRRAFILGEHSHLFVIRFDSRECEQVVYLGHERGQIVAPPALVSGFLVIPERRGSTEGRLRVVNIQGGATDGLRVVQTIDLPRPVAGPLQVLGTRFVVITSDGQLRVYQLRGGDEKQPFGLLAEGKTPDPTASQKGWAVPRFVLFHKDQVLAADMALTLFELQASAGKLVPRWVACQETLALSSPVVQDSTIFYIYRYPDRPGVFITAVDVESGRVFWESQVADPPLMEAHLTEDGQKAQIIGQSGNLYIFEPNAASSMLAGIRPDRVLRFPGLSEGKAPIGCVLPSKTRVIGILGNRELTVLEPERDRMRVASLPLPEGLGSVPVPFRNGVLVALEDGTLANLDVTTGRPLGEPYQCEMAAGARVTWSDLVALDETTLLAANSAGWLLKLRWAEKPNGHFQAEHSRLFDAAIASPLAILDDTIIAVDSKMRSLAISLSDLNTQRTQPLDSDLVWGPWSLSTAVCFATADGTLVLSTPQLEFTKVNLEGELPVGKPVVTNNHLVFATRQGSVFCVDFARGTVVNRINLRMTCCTGPTIVGENVLLGSLDGRWIMIPKTDVLHAATKD